MNQNYTQWIIGVIALAVVAGGAYLFWKQTSPAGSSPTATSTAATSSTPEYTVVEVPAASLPTPPEYKTPLVCGAGISESVCTQLQSQNATLVAQITKNETDGNAWINLGTLRKINDDYKGAEAAWSYVAKLYPSNPIAFSNLADLYMNFLHDYAKAESNYLKAIRSTPADTTFYKELFTLYTTTSYTPSATAAESVLKKGIVANPDAIDLPVTLARYYKSLGRTADAKAQYDAAIANAKAQGKTEFAAQIEAEAAESAN